MLVTGGAFAFCERAHAMCSGSLRNCKPAHSITPALDGREAARDMLVAQWCSALEEFKGLDVGGASSPWARVGHALALLHVSHHPQSLHWLAKGVLSTCPMQVPTSTVFDCGGRIFVLAYPFALMVLALQLLPRPARVVQVRPLWTRRLEPRWLPFWWCFRFLAVMGMFVSRRW